MWVRAIGGVLEGGVWGVCMILFSHLRLLCGRDCLFFVCRNMENKNRTPLIRNTIEEKKKRFWNLSTMICVTLNTRKDIPHEYGKQCPERKAGTAHPAMPRGQSPGLYGFGESLSE